MKGDSLSCGHIKEGLAVLNYGWPRDFFNSHLQFLWGFVFHGFVMFSKNLDNL